MTGLANQALSFRRDVNKRDYLNKFYEQYLMPTENMPFTHQQMHGFESMKPDLILMERSYLKPWKQFVENA